MSEKRGKLVIFAAPSGAGKSSIVNYLLPKFPSLSFSISATSRQPRGTEQNGKDYFFLSTEEFLTKIKNKELLEWEEVYPSAFYGTLQSEVEQIWAEGKVVVFDIDVVGAINLKKQYGDNALAIFVQAPSIKALEIRLQRRGTDSEEKIAQRISKASKEMARAPEFDKVIVNSDFNIATAEASKIIEEFLNQK